MASPTSSETKLEKGTASTEMHNFPRWKPSWNFWKVFVALSLLSFISALDSTIVATALPTITEAVHASGSQYIWIANCFVLASSVPQPIFGQMSNIFGRRNLTIVSVLLFAVGSGIAGAATNPGMLISGRSIHGFGAGGIYVCINVIICDLVPLRQRGKYLGIIFAFAGVGTTIAPVIGGALAIRDWRWIFWLNIPVSAVALAVVVLCLHLNHVRSPSWLHALSRVDFAGSALFILAMTSLLWGIITGGTQYPWTSWRVILPIVLGSVAWLAFHMLEASGAVHDPLIPTRLFANRTSAAAYLLAFLANVAIQALLYFLPIYFQAVLRKSVLASGIAFLAFAIPVLLFAILGGSIVTKTGHYKPVHWFSFGGMAVCFGLFTLLDQDSGPALWASFQVIATIACGPTFSAVLPAIMAALPESDVALRSELANGGAYALASQHVAASASAQVRGEVLGVYVKALRATWYACIAVSGLAFLLVFVERHVPLRTELKTEFGLKEKGDERSLAVGFEVGDAVAG
ncbi:MFS general substrate transporter [Lophiostoma macrostomum CBS 122681]|uniref:MFS general substrate transporter n=1 Tax=Lophiostoma macrostomum CBS 122681 TaxID=1314788 RepID=A0A6A6TAH3_9PLEO|nr:MFS general substrate transporter [Lophiostoma macrostomum CBS 122681]